MLSASLVAFALAVAALLSQCSAEIEAIFAEQAPVFAGPSEHHLVPGDAVGAALFLPPDYVQDSLEVLLDGEDVTDLFERTGEQRWTASLGELADGDHVLAAQFSVDAGGGAVPQGSVRTFSTVRSPVTAGCELLNGLDCLLPYPSSRFLEPADTGTGVRIAFPAGGMPNFLSLDTFQNQRLSPEPYRALDGFSIAVQILMHFPGDVDLALSNASRLLEATRSYDESSLDPNHPTLLIDAETGEQVLHFLEVDARAVDRATGERNPLFEQIVFLRPGEHLRPGRRYIVAARRLVHPDGSDVGPEPVFKALRDGQPSSIQAVEAERARMARIFDDLLAAGLSQADLDELVLAFDFSTASVENTTGELVSMRDQALDWLAEQPGPTFTVDPDRSEQFDCDGPGQFAWRTVRGTFEVPLFVSSDPAATPADLGFLLHDENGVPRAEGTTQAPFTVVIPCVARDGTSTVRPALIGHGLGMTGDQMLGALDQLADGAGVEQIAGFEYVLGATDWHGLSGPDFAGVINLPPAGFLGGIFRDFDNFAALPDRLRQSQVNTVVLARLLRDAHFNSDAWFQDMNGRGVLPGRDEPAFYFGVSLGGIMGTFLAALTPDIERFNVDVGATNFSILLSRATPFRELEDLLFNFTQPNVTIQALGIQLIQELWTRGEPAGYARHVTGSNAEPLPGAGPKKILMTVARFDHQVSNQASEIMARTLRIPSLEGTAEPDKPGIPVLPGPLDSALVYYDSGALVPGVDDQDIPPLMNRRVARGRCDPHSARLTTPASLDQLSTFLQPDGEIVNFCDGICDGRDSLGNFHPPEIPGGADEPCDPDA